ncbi:MAG: hypothetical protein JST90_14770 [Bacteroidetes bacterium]|nr:hypothetical protein [Bacteroidota bacterium]
MSSESPVILALHTFSGGLGYACIQVPERLLDYGVTKISPVSNNKALSKAEKFISYYRPQVVLMRDGSGDPKSGRSRKLRDAIETLAGEMGVDVYRYTKEQVAETFEVFGVTTKHGIVSKIVEFLPELGHRTPKERRWYEKDDYNMPIFNAVALAITHAHRRC